MKRVEKILEKTVGKTARQVHDPGALSGDSQKTLVVQLTGIGDVVQVFSHERHFFFLRKTH